MSGISKVTFEGRWKEELVGTMDGHTFILIMTMGVTRVYFPLREAWEERAPDWAKGQWERVKKDLEEWCAGAHIPLVIDDESWVCFE